MQASKKYPRLDIRLSPDQLKWVDDQAIAARMHRSTWAKSRILQPPTIPSTSDTQPEELGGYIPTNPLDVVQEVAALANQINFKLTQLNLDPKRGMTRENGELIQEIQTLTRQLQGAIAMGRKRARGSIRDQ